MQQDVEYGHLIGLRLAELVLQQAGPVFTAEEAIRAGESLGISPAYARRLLSRLASGGLLRRLKGGLYCTDGILEQSSGHPHDFAIATKIVQPSAISHESALHHWGLIDQVPMRVTASTPKSFVTPSMRQATRGESTKVGHDWVIDGVRYHYVRVAPEAMFGVEQEWVDATARVPIFDRERSLLDAFAYRRIGASELGLEILAQHPDDVDLDRLVAYAEQLDRPHVLKRVRAAASAVRSRVATGG